MRKKRIGLLGGTFNPVHMGHLKAAEVVQKRFLSDKILFIPSYIPPHKESAEVASPFHRFKMVELALVSHPQFVASSIEIDAKGKSYSIITLNKIKMIYPKAWIFFILGIDAFLEIDSWKEHERVLEQCFLIVISRPGYRLTDAKRVFMGKYRESICELKESEEIKDEMLLLFKIFLLSIEALDVASTEIRKRVKKGDSIKGMVTKAVEAYIRENNLYQR